MTQLDQTRGYKSIKQVVLNRIQDGTWAPDSFLPTEMELATEFSSTRTTVNRALRELAEEGYLERKRKSGTRVLEAPVRQARLAIPLIREEIRAAGASYRYFHVSSGKTPLPAWLAGRLNLSTETEAVHVRSLHYADESPFQFEDRWIIAGSVAGLDTVDFKMISPNEWLVQTVPVSNVDLSFGATNADAEVARLLDTPEGSALFLTERVTWLRGAPVTFTRMYHAPGYRMTTKL